MIQQDMTKGSPLKLILLFTMPILLGNLFQQFYSMADTLIVSQTLGVESFAAVGSTGSIINLIIGFAIGLTAGLSVITSQYFGRRDEAGIRRNLATSVIISGIVSVMLTVLSVIFARPILSFMQTPVNLIDEAYSYVIVMFAGIGITMFFNLLSNILRAIGDSKTPLIFLALTSLLNIVLDYFFIFALNTGVEGAAYATIISQIISIVLCLIYIWKYIPTLRIYKEDWKVSRTEVKKHLAISLPMGFQSSIIAIGALAVQMTLNSLGASAVAATAAAQKIDSFVQMPMQSFGIAMATYTAQNFGAGKNERVWIGINKVAKIVVGYSIVMAFTMVLFGADLSKIFVGNDPEVLELVNIYFVTNAPFYFLLALLYLYRYTLQGFGKSSSPTLAGIMELLSRVIGAVVLSTSLGFIGVVIATPFAWLTALIPVLGSYYIFKRRMQGKTRIPLIKLALTK